MYSYSYAGECELDVAGTYPDRQTCLEAGRKLGGPMQGKEMWYQIHCYDLDSTLQLAPSDRVAVLKRLTGVSVSHRSQGQVLGILTAIIDNDYDHLTAYPELLPFLRRRHPFSLTFTIPTGRLSTQEILDYPGYDDTQVTSLAVANGIVLANLKRGDMVRFRDIPLANGSITGYNPRDEPECSIGHVRHQGCRLGSVFAINSFPRVDYFRYSLPGNGVLLLLESLEPATPVATRVSSQLYRVNLGKFRIFTRELARLTRRLNSDRGQIDCYYGLRAPDDDSSYLYDLYTEPN